MNDDYDHWPGCKCQKSRFYLGDMAQVVDVCYGLSLKMYTDMQ